MITLSDALSGLSPAQAAAVAGVVNIADPQFREGVAVAISTALGSTIGQPQSDAAVLSAIGQALVRYSAARASP